MSLGRSRQPWTGILTALAVFAALGAIAGSSGAQDQDSVAFGKVTYRVYCRNCHGADAKGDGSLAGLMKVRPSDLTRISHDNGGTFPADKVKAIIDGREEVLAHGSREMPIWGQALTGDDAEVRTKIERLTAFLESLQEAPGAARKGG
jgi:mono/diheme cytochrome c family protein